MRRLSTYLTARLSGRPRARLSPPVTPPRGALAQRLRARVGGALSASSKLAEAEDGTLVPLSELRPRRPRAPAAGNTARTDHPLFIPCPDPTAEEHRRDRLQARGQRLARQDDWETLSDRLAAADASRACTPGGVPEAELLSFGARADVVQAAEHALLFGSPAPGAPLLLGISQLEGVLADTPDCPMIAAVVAQAHVDIGWAWRGAARTAEVPRQNLEAFAAHLDRARAILQPHGAALETAPLLAGVACAANQSDRTCPDITARAFERLITLDPGNARSFRAMGLRLLPRWGGDLGALELQARRMAARTHDTWGAGGYTWAMFDAIACDEGACAALDVPFFIDGLRDILQRTDDQHIANLLAAYCAATMGGASGGSDEAGLVRARIAACADWIVRERLTELHPLTWAHAARGFDQALRVRCPKRFAAAGRADAQRLLEAVFHREIAAGQRIVFGSAGVEAVPA